MIGVPGSGVLLCKSDAFLSFSSLMVITSMMTDLERIWVKAFNHGFGESSRKDLYHLSAFSFSSLASSSMAAANSACLLL